MTPSGTECSSDCQVQGERDLANYFRPLPDGYWPVPPLGRGMGSYPKIPRAWWLRIAEIELSILARQCLDRRIHDLDMLRREVAAWEEVRNEQHATVSGHFTTAHARRKLDRFYRS